MNVTINELEALMQTTLCAGEVAGRMLDLGRELLLVARCGEPNVDEQFTHKCTTMIPASELHKFIDSSHDKLQLIVEDDRNIEKEKRRYYILLSYDEALNSNLIKTLNLRVSEGGIISRNKWR